MAERAVTAAAAVAKEAANVTEMEKAPKHVLERLKSKFKGNSTEEIAKLEQEYDIADVSAKVRKEAKKWYNSQRCVAHFFPPVWTKGCGHLYCLDEVEQGFISHLQGALH